MGNFWPARQNQHPTGQSRADRIGGGALARRLNAKVNLIPYNTVEGLPWSRPDDAVCEQFQMVLKAQKIVTTLRREKGHDIDAACGQLRLKTERELAAGSVEMLR